MWICHDEASKTPRHLLFVDEKQIPRAPCALVMTTGKALRDFVTSW